MRERIVGLLDEADLAIASCAGVVDEAHLGPLIESVRNARTRLGYPEEILVVALAGGTGSGKSSLLNAMVGDEVVTVGGIRPTTVRPAAILPPDSLDAMTGYLDRIDVGERYPTGLQGVCLLDLPDIDSVEVAHHHRVDRLLPKVDLVVWVTDPEKYNDSRLHDDYLKPMASFAAQFLFVLNQADRVSPEQAEELRDHLTAALRSDGIDSPRVMVTSASPVVGQPIGVDQLVVAIGERGADRGTLYGKVLTDIETAARALETSTGSHSDYDSRAAMVRDRTAATLANGEMGAASEDLTGFLGEIAAEAGGPIEDSLRRLASEVPRHLIRIEEQVSPRSAGSSRWWRRRPAGTDPAVIGRMLDESVFRPARALLAKRVVAIESVTELGREVQDLRNESSR